MDKPMNEREDCITMITDSGESVDLRIGRNKDPWKRLSAGNGCARG